MKYLRCIIILTSFVGYGSTTFCQTINKNLLQKIVEKNERVLGLGDTTLLNETRNIRIFNLSDSPIDPDLLVAINPLNGLYSISYSKRYNIDIVTDKKFKTDINTGEYRDLFIMNIEAKNDTLKIATIAFKFKSNDCINQTRILGVFEFIENGNDYILHNFHLGTD